MHNQPHDYEGDDDVKDQRTGDMRLSKLLNWAGVVFGGIVTIASCWCVSTLVSLDKNVALLLARPESVSKMQYDSDIRDMKGDINDAKRDIQEVKLKQAEALGRIPK